MSLRFACPHENCRRALLVEERHAGREARCPGCGGMVRVPFAEAASGGAACEGATHAADSPARTPAAQGLAADGHAEEVAAHASVATEDCPRESAKGEQERDAALAQLVESCSDRLIERIAGLEQRLLEQTTEWQRMQQQFAELGQAILAAHAGETAEGRVEQWTAVVRDAVSAALARRPASGALSATLPGEGTSGVQTPGRRGASYDLSLDGVWHRQLALRATMLLVVKHLCGKGATPEAIAAAAGKRNVFWSVAGVVDAREFRQRGQSADDGSRTFAPARYFCRERELITSGDRTYALTSQWRAADVKTLHRLLNVFADCGIVCTASGEGESTVAEAGCRDSFSQRSSGTASLAQPG